MTSDICVMQHDKFLEVRFQREAKKNAITSDMYRAMTLALSDVSSDSENCAILFTAAGTDFCAGNDIVEFAADAESSNEGLEFIRAIAHCEKPIIAAVQGLAVGIGTTMLFHCDLIFAAPNARFIVPFVDLGLVPEAGSSLLAPIVLGNARASRMLLLGEPLDADEAAKAGFVSALTPLDELSHRARSAAAMLASKPPEALAATRRLLRGDRSHILARIDAEAALFERALRSSEAKKAFVAFMKGNCSG